jgi:ORF6N domain-containing protein
MSAENIAQSIQIIRGRKVLLDAELAALYGVSVKRLNEQVRRNLERFPRDFVFHLTDQEVELLRSQIATLNAGSHGRGRHRKYRPYAFTEHGAIMVASVLNSPRAIEMSVYVVRAFIRLRELLASNTELARRLDELEARLTQKLDSHDQAIVGILEMLRTLRNPPQTRAIGFTVDRRD